MAEEENFDINWLSERYPFDAEARNKALESKVFNFLKEKDSLTLVDVGSGTGSNCLYFIEQLPQNQIWFIIEQNETLERATIRRFKDYAAYYKYSFEKRKNRLIIHSQRKKLEINLINQSMLDLPQLVDLSKVDLVLANAVFDLFSKEQFETFAQFIINSELPFFATLNYSDMTFEPEDPFDTIFINQYNAHMQRQQVFGRAMGKNASAFIKQYFESKNCSVDLAPSTWKIEQDDIKMHYYLLSFMENALDEMKMDVAMQANFKKWLQRKKDLVITRRQRLEVNHFDIFVCSV